MAETAAFTSVSPLDGRYARAVKPLQTYFSEYALVKYRIKVEVAWFRCLLALPDFCTLTLSGEDERVLERLEQLTAEEALEVKRIEAVTNHDIKAVEYFIKQTIEKSGRSLLIDAKEFVHFGCTSEDINNLAYGLMIKDGIATVLRPRLVAVIQRFGALAARFHDVPMLALTHGQPATPTTFGKETALFAARLVSQLRRLDEIPIMGKFSGAVGNFNALVASRPEVPWRQVTEMFVQSLGLTYQPYATQIEAHDHLSCLANAWDLIQTILIGACQDFWTYISRGRLRLRKLENEVGSSTMPHKVNPIDFENAEGNFGASKALLKFFSSKLPISRMQRDLSDSTVLRNVGSAFGYTLVGLTSLEKGLDKIDVDCHVLEHELDQHWEILAEPIQTILRNDHVDQAYEILKSATRGSALNAAEYRAMLNDVLRHVKNPDTSARLQALTPSAYIGLAPQIALEIAESVANLQ